MTVFALVQTFLTSMILGVIIPWIDLKVGSSPFLLLREAQPDLPVWSMQPNFIPKDGRGLNPLLQNYWMVIHPPTLFLGFALTLVPFAYLIAGLWKKKLTEWVQPALPWALFGAGILGVGIMMGAYWAYETLNFGGYWNWDPVENASFVPWLVLLGAIHTMIAYKTSSSALKTSIILVIATFILVLYSTFLNRSGILGNASVHSFTDLGLSGQLLLYMGTFLLVAIILIPTAMFVYSISQLGSPVGNYDASLVIGSYVGLLLLCAVFVCLSTLASALVSKQSLAFVLGLVFNFAIWQGMQEIQSLETWSVYTHYQQLSKGVIDVGSVFYFLGLCAAITGFIRLRLDIKFA